MLSPQTWFQYEHHHWRSFQRWGWSHWTTQRMLPPWLGQHLSLSVCSWWGTCQSCILDSWFSIYKKSSLIWNQHRNNSEIPWSLKSKSLVPGGHIVLDPTPPQLHHLHGVDVEVACGAEPGHGLELRHCLGERLELAGLWGAFLWHVAILDQVIVGVVLISRHWVS